MDAPELAPWDPMSPREAAIEFTAWPHPWWVAGGWAIDLLLGRQTRPHGDLDIIVLRRDQARVRDLLSTWDVYAADPPGVLRRWPIGEILPEHVHDVWCRRRPGAAWELQLMIEDTDGDEWVFRRDPRVRRSIESLTGRASTADLPVLSADVQLLYKSRDARAKDLADLEAVGPHLTSSERDWLRCALGIVSPGHPWISLLRSM